MRSNGSMAIVLYDAEPVYLIISILEIVVQCDPIVIIKSPETIENVTDELLEINGKNWHNIFLFVLLLFVFPNELQSALIQQATTSTR